MGGDWTILQISLSLGDDPTLALGLVNERLGGAVVRPRGGALGDEALVSGVAYLVRRAGMESILRAHWPGFVTREVPPPEGGCGGKGRGDVWVNLRGALLIGERSDRHFTYMRHVSGVAYLVRRAGMESILRAHWPGFVTREVPPPEGGCGGKGGGRVGTEG
jgi:hypothetical protein